MSREALSAAGVRSAEDQWVLDIKRMGAGCPAVPASPVGQAPGPPAVLLPASPPALRWSAVPTVLAPENTQPLRVAGARGLDLALLGGELTCLLGSDLGVNPRTIKENQWIFGKMSRVAWSALSQGRRQILSGFTPRLLPSRQVSSPPSNARSRPLAPATRRG